MKKRNNMMMVTLTFNNEKEMENIKELFREEKKEFIGGNKSISTKIDSFGYTKKSQHNGFEQIELYYRNTVMNVLLKYLDDIVIIKED